MPGTVKSELFSGADRSHKCDGQESLLWENLPIDKSHFITAGKDSLEYSFHFGMGGNTIAMYAYYLVSPLNILMIFCPTAAVGEGLTLLICLKLILCGITAYVYLWQRFRGERVYTILLSVSYAMMGYNILHCSNIMWLDGVIILPIIALGLHRLVWEEKCGTYFVALFYGVFVNWYIGYMLCLFAVLYYLFEIADWQDGNRSVRTFTQNADIKKYTLHTFWEFGVTSILSVASTAMLFLPQTMYMMQEGEGFDWSIFSPAYNFSYLEGFRDLILEPDKLTQGSQFIPPIYVGSLAVILILAFFISHEISKYQKILAGIMLLGFMVVFMFKPLDYFFTVLKVPSNHYYRYAFLYSFFCIAIAGKALQYRLGKKKDTLLKAVLLFCGITAVFDMVRPYANRSAVVWSVGVAILLTIMLCRYASTSKYVKKGILVMVMALLVMSEFAVKAYMEFIDHTENRQIYQTYNQTFADAVGQLRENDPSAYRIDKMVARSPLLGNNEGLAYGYSSIAQYSSSNNVSMTKFLSYMGYNKDQTLVDYEPILPVDALLGDKYIYSPNPVFGCVKIADHIYQDVDLYQNPYALPFAYVSDEKVQSIDFGEDAFDNQELLYNSLLGYHVQLYNKNDMVAYDTDGTSSTTWEIEVTHPGAVYIYCLEGASGTSVYLNDELKFMNSWHNDSMMFLGEFQPGDHLNIRIVGGKSYSQDSLDCRTLDLDAMKAAIQILRMNSSSDVQLDSKEVSLSYDAEKAGQVLLTIPFEKGWTATNNGNKVEIKQAADAMMLIPVTAGANTIHLTFALPWKWSGIFVTVMSCVVFYVWRRLIRKKRSKQ